MQGFVCIICERRARKTWLLLRPFIALWERNILQYIPVISYIFKEVHFFLDVHAHIRPFRTHHASYAEPSLKTISQHSTADKLMTTSCRLIWHNIMLFAADFSSFLIAQLKDGTIPCKCILISAPSVCHLHVELKSADSF